MNILLRFCIFTVLASMILSAQEPEPLSFFPHHVGDTWVYRYDNFYDESMTITRVVEDSNNATLIYHHNLVEPTCRIDSNLAVFYYPSTLDFKIYDLRAQLGDTWIASKDEDGSYQAKVVNVYNTLILGHPATVKHINYYEVPFPDTSITDNAAFVYSNFIASNFGFIRQISEAGDLSIDLKGCLINGDTLGIITGIQENLSQESLQISPNPCSSFTTITVPFSTQNDIYLAVYNSLGALVWQDRIQESAYTLNTTSLPTGIYFCRVTAGLHTAIHKIIIRH